jgi:hypothetical protein
MVTFLEMMKMAFGNTDINCCKKESTVRRCGKDAMVVCDGEELNMIWIYIVSRKTDSKW